ncbi:MAG: substrate-binding protein [Verrucomicrobia bacterium]|nr:MAG: substrate-binding protein [Verrucomicrobiota bacterium]
MTLRKNSRCLALLAAVFSRSSSPCLSGAMVALGAFFIFGCSNNPHPEPLAKVREDGEPWKVRYSALPEDPRSLDPQVSYDAVSRRVLEPVQECLLEYQPFKTDPYELTPCLLLALPERIERTGGGITYRCALKPGIFFHNDPCFPEGRGREVVAEDVLFAFRRIADPKVECPALSTLQDYIEGFAEMFEAARKADSFDYSQPVSGLQVTGKYTFEIHLKAPYPQLLYWLAMHFTSPVAREAVEYYDGKTHDGAARDMFRFHPVGTGPFQVAEWKRNTRIRLKRNPVYRTTAFPTEGWDADREALLRPLAGKALPFVDEVNMTVFRETIPVFLLFRQGYLDEMAVGKDAFSSLITPSRDLSEKYKERGVALHRDVEPSTFFMALNMEDPLLGTNRKLRQALSCAFDAKSNLDIFFNSVPIVSEQLLPPGIAGYRKEFRNPYGYNLQKAKVLLAEAGYPNGKDANGKVLEITLDTTGGSANERLMAEFYQQQFEQLGIKVKVVENPFARLMDKLDNGGFQIAAGSGWGADYPDPENFYFLYYSKNLPPAGKNHSRYKNSEFDRLFEAMATMENSAVRDGIVLKMNDILAEDVPHILNMHRSSFRLSQPWAPRIQSNPLLEGGLKYVVIEHGLREQLRTQWNKKPVWPVAALLAMVAGSALLALNARRKS